MRLDEKAACKEEWGLRLWSQVLCMEKGGNVIKDVTPVDIEVTAPLVEEPEKGGLSTAVG